MSLSGAETIQSYGHMPHEFRMDILLQENKLSASKLRTSLDSTRMTRKIGSMGRDFLEGTSVSDALYGDSSGTLSSRSAGGDALHGYNGADYLYGDVRYLRLTGRGGTDTIWAGFDGDTAYGDSYTMSSSSAGGSDRIWGESGYDRLYGDARTMSGSARGGADKLYAAMTTTAFSAMPIPCRRRRPAAPTGFTATTTAIFSMAMHMS
jgi:hypothetical protein